MFVELLGLPGAGKTSVSSLALQMFRRRGMVCDRLQTMARAAMDRSRPEINFLQAASERVGLYGCFSFAAEYPDLFDHLMQTVRHDPARLLWNMDMLSQLHFARRQMAPGQIILVDEGLMHRGAASYLDQPTDDVFRDYLDCLTGDFVTVIFDAPVAVCMDRVAARPKGMPALFRPLSPMAQRGLFERFAAMIEVAAEARASQGHAVLRIDTTQPAQIAAWELARAVQVQTLAMVPPDRAPQTAPRPLARRHAG